MVDEGNRQVVVGGAVCSNGRLLAARRTAPPVLAGLWELPGGKVEPGEETADALVRELREELGIEVKPVQRVLGEWPLLKPGLVLQVWTASLEAGEPLPLQDHDAVQWVDPREALSIPWVEQDVPAVELVVAMLLQDASVERDGFR